MKVTFGAILVALAFLLYAPAEAACPGSLTIFTNNVSIVDAATTNANNTHAQTCYTTVDNSQVGTLGFYATQIIPTSPAQAVFGGAQTYGFLNGLAFSLQAVVPAAGTNQMLLGVDSSGFGLFRAQNANGFKFQNGTGSSTYVAVNGTGLQVTGTGVFSGAVSGTSFAGSGSGLTGIPLTALTTPPVTSVTAGGNLSSTGGTTPVLSLTANPSFTTVNASGLIAASGYLAGGAPSINTQGAWLQWNRSNGSTFLVNQKGLGSGGVSVGHSDTSNNYTQDTFTDELGNFTVRNNFVANGTVIANGTVTASANGGSGPTPPCYGLSGAACSITMHTDYLSCVPSSTTNCTISLSGAAVFASTAYACAVSSPSGAGPFWAVPNSGSLVTLTASSATSVLLTAICSGN